MFFAVACCPSTIIGSGALPRATDAAIIARPNGLTFCSDTFFDFITWSTLDCDAVRDGGLGIETGHLVVEADAELPARLLEVVVAHVLGCDAGLGGGRGADEVQRVARGIEAGERDGPLLDRLMFCAAATTAPVDGRIATITEGVPTLTTAFSAASCSCESRVALMSGPGGPW